MKRSRCQRTAGAVHGDGAGALWPAVRFGRCLLVAAFLVAALASAPVALAEGFSVGSAQRDALAAPAPAPARQATRLDYLAVEPGLRIALAAPAAGRLVPPPAAGRPPRIGFHRALPARFQGELAGRLVWTELADGVVVGALTVASPGAVAVRLALLAQLPAQTEIRFFNPAEPARRFRVVTARDFHVLPDGELEPLWSPVVDGDAIGLEVALPSGAARAGFSLRLDKVSHQTAQAPRTAFQGAQCPGQVDVQCRVGSVPMGIPDSVARIRFEGTDGPTYCSATLLNNQLEDYSPYLLTANHCVSTPAAARSIEATWFFERPGCGSAEPAERGVQGPVYAQLLATSADQDSTLLRLDPRGVPIGVWHSGWDAGQLTHPTAVYGIHHPRGDYKKYSAGVTVRNVPVELDGADSVTVNAIEVEWHDGLTEQGSSGSGLFTDAHLVGVLSARSEGCGGLDAYYGNFADFYFKACPWLTPNEVCAGRHIPLFLSASSSVRHGFARIINRSDWAGEVQITAIDDAGARFGPITVALGAASTIHFNSNDLERGNPAKGIARGVGTGQGDWRLELKSDLNIEALAYVRTADGFVTTMHDVAPAVATATGLAYQVPFFNPGSNMNQVSKLRLVNPSDRTANVLIRGRDDRGFQPGPVRLAVPAGTARTVTARQLERGEGLSGAFGDRVGKWSLTVESDAAIEVMNLLDVPTGNLANLSSIDASLVLDELAILPLFLPAGNAQWHGFVRVSNHTGAQGTVTIHAIDERGRAFGPVELTLTPRQTAHFNSTDLERGNPDKGLVGRVGNGTGNWMLALTTDLDAVQAIAYVRTADGFVTSMDAVVRDADGRHTVPLFNPGSNRDQRSSLRLINLGDADASVTITAIDDSGRSAPAGDVRLTLGEDESRTVTALALEAGDDDLTGRLGDGTGKWRLTVRADQPLAVMNLLLSPTGNLANLSTTTAP